MKCTKCEKTAEYEMQYRDPQASNKHKDKLVKESGYIYGFCEKHWQDLLEWLSNK